MSIFCDNTFVLSVKYAHRYDRFGNISGVKILPDDATEESVGEPVYELFCEAARDDSDMMYRIEEEGSVVNHITGKTLIRKAILVPAVLNAFFRDWRMEEIRPGSDEPVPIPFSQEALRRLPGNLKTALAFRWLRMSY